MSWLWRWLADMPSTNTRIFITLIIFMGTAIRYWYTAAVPDRDWLFFLGIMAGVDALQFGAKRATEKPTPPLGKDQEDTASTKEMVVPKALLGTHIPATMDQDEA